MSYVSCLYEAYFVCLPRSRSPLMFPLYFPCWFIGIGMYLSLQSFGHEPPFSVHRISALSSSCLRNMLTFLIISSDFSHSLPTSFLNNYPSNNPYVNATMIIGSSLGCIFWLISLNLLKTYWTPLPFVYRWRLHGLVVKTFDVV